MAELLGVLGYDCCFRDFGAADVASEVGAAAPEVTLVTLLPNEEGALETIGAVAHGTSCPAVALMPELQVDFATAAAAAGVYAVSRYLVDELAAALEIARRRSADWLALLAAFQRRATIERAKGVLMVREGVDGDAAFALLRRHSQRSNRRLVEVAEALLAGYPLLLPTGPPRPRAG